MFWSLNSLYLMFIQYLERLHQHVCFSYIFNIYPMPLYCTSKCMVTTLRRSPQIKRSSAIVLDFSPPMHLNVITSHPPPLHWSELLTLHLSELLMQTVFLFHSMLLQAPPPSHHEQFHSIKTIFTFMETQYHEQFYRIQMIFMFMETRYQSLNLWTDGAQEMKMYILCLIDHLDVWLSGDRCVRVNGSWVICRLKLSIGWTYHLQSSHR